MIPGTRARPAGFTVIEILMVLVILGLVAAVGAPSMRDLIASTRVKGAASDLFGSLMFARSEAIKRNANVDVVPVSASNWTAGWSVKVGSDTLTVTPAIAGGVASSGPTSSVRYRGDGRLIDPSSGALLAGDIEFRFIASEHAHIQMRCVEVTPSGRPRVRTDTDRNSANGCNI
jgi:type IV fimbrial biogenesis protein FimT